ncbi:MAG: RagB/SusD family nutrient uptake outer membrane protein, partial [Myxococcota bacterium]
MKYSFSSKLTVLTLALLMLGACYDDVENNNGVALDQLEESPTPALLSEAVVGLQIGHRAGK